MELLILSMWVLMRLMQDFEGNLSVQTFFPGAADYLGELILGRSSVACPLWYIKNFRWLKGKGGLAGQVNRQFNTLNSTFQPLPSTNVTLHQLDP